jgi:pimeloyl-ACP methyl ester carboxylesterase
MKASAVYIMVLFSIVLICCSRSEKTDQDKTEKKNNMKMQFKTSGEGETPVILVPGGLTGMISWDPHAAILSKKRKVIQVQLLNVQWGIENQALPRDYSIKTESEALAHTLNILNISEPFDLVGWSYGAFASLQFALDFPHLVRTLTLIEPPAMWVLRIEGKYPEHIEKTVRFFKQLTGEISEDMLADFLDHAGFVPSDMVAQQLPQWTQWLPYRNALRNSPAVVNYQDDVKRLQQFDKPTLLVQGGGSSSWLHEIIYDLNKNIPHSRIVEYPGGHAAHIVSMENFMHDLNDFHSTKQ